MRGYATRTQRYCTFFFCPIKDRYAHPEVLHVLLLPNQRSRLRCPPPVDLAASTARQSSLPHCRLPPSRRLHRLRPSSSRLAHTRSDQPTCAIHLAPVTSVIVLRASSPSMEGGRCFASSGSSGTVHGVPHRCIFTAADYVLDFVHAGHFDCIFDIVYDYVSARLARTWSSPSCSSSSSPSSSSAAASSGSSGLVPDRPGLPRRFV